VTEQWNLCEEEEKRRENSCYNEAKCLEHGCDCFDNSRYEKREDSLKSDRHHEERELTIAEKINKIRRELNLPVKNEKCFVEERVYEKDDEKSYLPFYNRYSRPATAASPTRSRPKVVYKSRSRTQSRSPSSSKRHWVPTGANYYYDTHNNRSRLMQNFKL